MPLFKVTTNTIEYVQVSKSEHNVILYLYQFTKIVQKYKIHNVLPRPITDCSVKSALLNKFLAFLNVGTLRGV